MTLPEKLLLALADGRPVRAHRLAQRTDANVRRVYVALNRLRIRGVLERVGERGRYRYQLAREPWREMGRWMVGEGPCPL